MECILAPLCEIKMSNKVMMFILLLWITSCQDHIREFYIIEDEQLVPEGIDFSLRENAFYLTSVAKSKIIKVDAITGAQENFIDENEYGFMPGVGLLIDDEQNELHALSGYYMLDGSQTSLHTFDLISGDLKRKVYIQDDGDHFLNDMIMDRHGGLYVTDTKSSGV